MARKNILAPKVIESQQSLSANFISEPTIIDFMDNCSYQINVTTSNSTGTFAVQASLDYIPPTADGPLGVPGNWVSLSLGGGVPTVAAANDSILINLNQLPFRAIRLSYASTVAGTGIADIIIMNKSVGN